MNLKNISKGIIISITMILLIFMSSAFNYSQAAAVGFISFNNAPRKYMTISENGLADITVRIEDNNGVSSVQLYTVNSKGEKKAISFSSANTSNNTSHVYTISHSKILKGKDQQFYIVAKDKTGNTLQSYFKIVVKSKTVKEKKKVYDKKKKKNVTKTTNKTVKYYAINDSPRVLNPTASGNNVTLGIKDNGGSKYAKIQDANNKNKEIYKFDNLAKGEAKVKIDMTNFTPSNGVYKLRIVTEDHSGQKAVRTIYFKMNVTTPAKKTTSSNKKSTSTTSSNKTITPTTKVPKDKNVSSFITALERMSQKVQSDYKAKKYWKYTNGVKSINRLPIKATYQSALNSNVLTTNCAQYVMWALHDCGIFAANQKFYGHASGNIRYVNNKKAKVSDTLDDYADIFKIGGSKRPKTLVREGKLKKGDILTYKGHTNVYAGDGKWYDAGRRMGQNGKGTMANYTFTTLGPLKITYNNPTYYIIRLKDQT